MNAATHTNDNVYYKHAHQQGQAPQAYVPYAPRDGAQGGYTRPYVRPAPLAAADEAMMPLAIVGLCVTVMFGVPVGLFTGPMALQRASRIEHLVNVGQRPATDRGNVTGARICAWVSIAWSIPLLLMWLAMILMIVATLAG